MKVLYLANPLMGGTGGDRRSFEVLQRVGQHRIEPVIVVDEFVLEKMKSEGNPFCRRYKIYSIKRPNVVYDRYFRSASRAALDYFSIFKTANLITSIAGTEHVDLIVSHHEKTDFLLEAYFAAKKLRVPWTCVFQLPLFPPYVSSVWRPVRGARKIYMYALYARLYALVSQALASTVPFAVSPSIELETKRYLGKSSKMLVLRPGVGVDNEKMQRVSAAHEPVDVFFFSRLAPEKGIYDLPQIAAEMAKVKPDLKFLFGGRFGAVLFRDNFEGLVAKNQLGDRLVYKGFLRQKELYALVKAAKVLVYPSRHDAFPLVILETLACGTPVVAYDIPAVGTNFPADIVKPVPVGNTKQMAAEALKIVNNQDLREKISQKATAFTAQYSWENVAVAEVEAYNRLFAKFNNPTEPV
ncbi:MAG: glycosyltransferase [Candidatus Bathyarchaeia archaeon]